MDDDAIASVAVTAWLFQFIAAIVFYCMWRPLRQKVLGKPMNGMFALWFFINPVASIMGVYDSISAMNKCQLRSLDIEDVKNFINSKQNENNELQQHFVEMKSKESELIYKIKNFNISRKKIF